MAKSSFPGCPKTSVFLTRRRYHNMKISLHPRNLLLWGMP
jgi:hypothetical protein